MNEELIQEYFEKATEIFKLDEDIKQYREKMEKELDAERKELAEIIFSCNSKQQIVNLLRERAMKSDLRNSIYIGLHVKQLNLMKELQRLMDELGMNNTDIPVLDNLTGSMNEMVNAFENKIKEMTEVFQKNSLEFNEFLTNSLKE
ncbi:MAG: hypothetical protein IKU29_02940 [Parabacteroides sp.]|nr:hypothetical protein [Parabacteroides sp.]